MIAKLYQWVAAGSAASLLVATLVVAPVSAQATSGNGQAQSQTQAQDPCATLTQSLGKDSGIAPSNAATPQTNCWLSIAPNQKQWYKFHVGARSSTGDEKNDKDNANGVDDSDAAIVQLAMDVPGCITFEIWTLARLNAPPPVGSDASSEDKRKDKEIARGPVGTGSPEFAIVKDDSNNNNDSNKNANSAESNKNQNPALLIWRGGSTVSENFYIAVHNVRTDFACKYRLMVAGSTVSFPGSNTSSSTPVANPAASTYTNGTTNNSDTGSH